MVIQRMIDYYRFRGVLDRYANAPHVKLENDYSRGMRLAAKSCLDLLDAQPIVDAIVLPKGRPGDYLEWDVGTGATRFYYISAIHIGKDTVRYDIGDMCPVVEHGAILRILTEEEMKKEICSGKIRIETDGIRYYGERKDND